MGSVNSWHYKNRQNFFRTIKSNSENCIDCSTHDYMTNSDFVSQCFQQPMQLSEFDFIVWKKVSNDFIGIDHIIKPYFKAFLYGHIVWAILFGRIIWSIYKCFGYAGDSCQQSPKMNKLHHFNLWILNELGAILNLPGLFHLDRWSTNNTRSGWFRFQLFKSGFLNLDRFIRANKYKQLRTLKKRSEIYKVYTKQLN